MWYVEKVAYLIDSLFLSSSNMIQMIKSCDQWDMWHV